MKQEKDETDSSPHCATEETSIDYIEVFHDDGNVVSSCDGLSSDDSIENERPYILYERQRRQREVRRMQREAQAAEQAHKSLNGETSSNRYDDDVEQPLETPPCKPGFSSEGYVPGYLYGAECQILCLMTLLIMTCVAVGLMDRHQATPSEDREIRLNVTTLAPSLSPEDVIVSSTAPPPIVTKPSSTASTASTTATTPSTTMATTGATTPSFITSPGDGGTATTEGIIEWHDDLQNIHSTQTELLAMHAMGSTVLLDVTLPVDQATPHAWYTTVGFVSLGTSCTASVEADASTTLEISTDTTLVVCQDRTVLATTTHLFANHWDVQQSYETVSLDGSTSAGLDLERGVPNNGTQLVLAVVTDPDVTVLRVRMDGESRRHLRTSNRSLWLENDNLPRCPTDGVQLPRPNPSYPVSVWVVEDKPTRSDLVVCNAQGRVMARGTITLVYSDSTPWN